MATILTKKKDTTGAPSAGDLTNSTGGAELAVNTADKRLYTKDSGGNVVEIGTNPTSITTGTLNTSGAVVFNDAGADVDFRVEGDTDANLLFVDASTDRIGMGSGAPSEKLTLSTSVSSTYASGLSSQANPIGTNVRIENASSTTDTFAGVTFNPTNGGGQGQLAYIGGISTGSGLGADIVLGGRAASGYYATRMTLDSSGKLLVGSTSALNVGSGGITSTVSSGANIALEKSTGAAISFYQSGVATSTIEDVNSQGGLRFYTGTSGSLSERMRITSDGYLKASNNGVYVGPTGLWHELKNTANDNIVIMEASDASYTSNGCVVGSARAQNSAFSLATFFTNSYNDTEFKFRGDGNGYADGTWNNNGADYAEFFESANGQALTLGATVVLDGNKVREATDQDPATSIIGVVRPKEPSKASMVVGNTAWNKWANKYLTDDFDRYIMEDHDVVEWEEQVLEREAVEAVEAVVDEEGVEMSPAVPAQEAVYKTVQHSYESHAIPAGVTVPADATRKTHDDKGNKFQHYKLNPEWNPDSEYVNRENRPEWNIIGLLGQVKILKGQPVGDRWVKMRDISETVEEWFIR